MPQILPEPVRNFYLFSGMTEKEKGDLLKESSLRNFSQGEYLFTHGDPIDYFYIVCSGAVQLFRRTPEGRQFTTDVVSSGRPIGETKIFASNKEHQTSAVVVEDAAVMELRMQWVRENARKSSTFALNLLVDISQQTNRASVDAEHQANMTAAQRLACFLQQLCILQNADPRDFELPYSKSLIASRLGIEPETFSRALVKIREYGITVSGARVSIKDLDAVENYACSHCSIADECPDHQALERKMRDKPEYGT